MQEKQTVISYLPMVRELLDHIDDKTLYEYLSPRFAGRMARILKNYDVASLKEIHLVFYIVDLEGN